MRRLLDYFDNIEKEKLSHAYIISNTNLNNIRDDIEKIISKYIFKENIKIDNNVDIIVLNNDEESVKKEEIIDLIKNISTTSQFNNKKVYIINNCESLNGYCYNAILKTLEEPSDNVYAFLITNNIENVKDTIVSRCQKIIVNTKENEEFDEKTNVVANKIIKLIDKKQTNISLYKELYNEIEDNRELSDILECILNNYFIKIKSIESISDKRQEELLKDYSKKVIILNNIMSLVNSSLNKNLTIDRLFIEMWRC